MLHEALWCNCCALAKGKGIGLFRKGYSLQICRILQQHRQRHGQQKVNYRASQPMTEMFLSLQAVTAAAALNDVGSWALIGFQATFYSRVYEVGPEVYAPALAAILPVGGLLGAWGEAWLATGCQRTAAAPGSLEVLLVAKALQQRRQRVSVNQQYIDLSSGWLLRYKL